MSHSVRIGVLGDFNPEFRSHNATNDALQHAAAKLKVKLQSEWIATSSVLQPHAQKLLERFDGLWASPGSPYKSAEGMLKGIEFAIRRDWPFLGTCGGFQYTLIECARNVLGIKDADTAENNSGSKNIIISPLTNVGYVKNLLEAAKTAGVRKFILLSFPHVEGETTPEHPALGRLDASPSPVHFRTRLEAERYLFEACRVGPMIPLVCRSGMVTAAVSK